MTSRTTLLWVAAALFLGVSCSSGTGEHDAADLKVALSPVIQREDLGAFFLHPSRSLDGIDFRVVGATNMDTVTTLFVQSSHDVGQAWIDKLESYFTVKGSAIEVRMVESIGPGPDPTEPSVEEARPRFPVHAGTGVTFTRRGLHGTIGCRLTNGKTFLLSNNHVLANTNRKPPGTDSYQGRGRIGTLLVMECLSLHRNNTVDAAVACTTPSCVRSDTAGFAFEATPRTARKDDPVKKWGSASREVRYGTVKSTGGIYEVTLTDGNDYCFEDQILVSDDDPDEPFADPRDSGSVVVNKGTQQPVGLYFARIEERGRTWYVLNEFDHVLSRIQDLLPGNWKPREQLTIDTRDPAELELSCADSLSRECTLKGKLEDCSRMMIHNDEMQRRIAGWIQQHQSPNISLFYSRCAEEMLIVESGTGPPGNVAIGIGGELSREGADPFMFGEDATMDEVLWVWRDRKAAKP